MSAEAAKKLAPGFAKHPDYTIDIVPCAKRVRAVFNGQTVVDSVGAVLLLEKAHTPVYYFPREDVRLELAQRTEHSTHCPFKGDASYWTLRVDERVAENALWTYQSPYDEVSAIRDFVAPYWGRMDAWYEEDEEVFVHPRSPFVRIDVLRSSRPVRIELAGAVLAETRRARFLFETGLPTRYYIPREDVRIDLLEGSETRTACPYKGTAHHWSARIDGAERKDVAWSYPDPLPEVGAIQDHICFYDERVDAVFVDGTPQAKPATKWSND